MFSIVAQSVRSVILGLTVFWICPGLLLAAGVCFPVWLVASAIPPWLVLGGTGGQVARVSSAVCHGWSRPASGGGGSGLSSGNWHRSCVVGALDLGLGVGRVSALAPLPALRALCSPYSSAVGLPGSILHFLLGVWSMWGWLFLALSVGGDTWVPRLGRLLRCHWLWGVGCWSTQCEKNF